VALSGSFSEACWVDITDAAGKRLYYGLVPAGGRVSLAGVAPLRVLIGVQSAARLDVAGRSLVLPPAAPGVRSTRFQVAADGTVLPPAD
jgi:cytoskeleton protein RodZ